MSNFYELLEKSLQQYDSRKGFGRRHIYGDSNEIKQLRIIYKDLQKDLQKYKKSHSAEILENKIPKHFIDSAKKVVGYHRKNNRTRKKNLTAEIIEDFERFLSKDEHFNKLDNQPIKQIFDYCDPRAQFKMSGINRKFDQFFHPKQESKSEKNEYKYEEYKRIPDLWVMLFKKLKKYIDERQKRYSLRKIFYRDRQHELMLNEFLDEIKTLSLNNEGKNHDKFFPLQMGYDSYLNQPRFGKGVPHAWDRIKPEHDPKNDLFDFPFMIDLKTKDRAAYLNRNIFLKKIYMLWRLAFEINYARLKNAPHYVETLVDMARLLFSTIPKDQFVAYCQNVIQLFENKMDQYKNDPEYSDLVYIWQGYLGFKLYNEKNPQKAEELYTTGSVTVTSNASWSHGPINGTTGGISNDVKLIYPYRNRSEEHKKIFKVFFTDLLKNILKFDCTTRHEIGAKMPEIELIKRAHRKFNL